LHQPEKKSAHSKVRSFHCMMITNADVVVITSQNFSPTLQGGGVLSWNIRVLQQSRSK